MITNKTWPMRDKAEITKYASTIDSFPSKADEDIKTRRVAFNPKSQIQINVPPAQRVNIQITIIPTKPVDIVLPNKSLRGDAFKKFLADRTIAPQGKSNAARDALVNRQKTVETINTPETPHDVSTDSKSSESTITTPSPIQPTKILHGKELRAFIDARTVTSLKVTEPQAPKSLTPSPVVTALTVQTEQPQEKLVTPITKVRQVVQQPMQQQKSPLAAQMPVQQIPVVHQNTNELAGWFKEFRYETPQVMQPRVIQQNPNYLAGWFSEFRRT